MLGPGMGKKSDDQITEDETARRRDEAILRALHTPPKHHSEMKVGKRKAKTSAKASPQEKGGLPKAKLFPD
jgi:hypothetical protein